MNIQPFIKDLKVSPGTSRRFSCPNCGGGNTLSVTNDMGNMKWKCFRASCNVRGQTKVARSPGQLRSWIKGETLTEDEPLTLPSYLTNILSDEQAVDYLKKYHCMYAYQNRLAEFRFDPRQRRVVFLVKRGDQIIDAAGRALDRGVKPKWFRYGNSKYPFICGHNDVAALVEDGASACAVSPVMTGVALLGTSLQETFLAPLRKFSKVYICLDKDATKKSIEMHRVISYYVDTEVRLLEDDFKYLSPDEISQTLKLRE